MEAVINTAEAFVSPCNIFLGRLTPLDVWLCSKAMKASPISTCSAYTIDQHIAKGRKSKFLFSYFLATMAIFAQSLVVLTIFSLQCMPIRNVNAAAAIDNVVFCSDIVPADSPSFEVCATASYATPSPAVMQNGTVIYIGGYYYTYSITQGLEEGDETTGSPSDYSGIEVNVFRDDDDTCEVSVTVDGETTQCSSCKYCGSDSFSANCTNLENGRAVEVCESTVPDFVFFPLTADALESPYEAALQAFWVWLWNILQSLLAQARNVVA